MPLMITLARMARSRISFLSGKNSGSRVKKPGEITITVRCPGAVAMRCTTSLIASSEPSVSVSPPDMAPARAMMLGRSRINASRRRSWSSVKSSMGLPDMVKMAARSVGLSPAMCRNAASRTRGRSPGPRWTSSNRYATNRSGTTTALPFSSSEDGGLSVQRGITVLTKSDLVDAETLEVVTMEVAEFLAGSFLDPATSPIIPVSSKTGAGLDQLQRELARLAAEVPAKDSSAVFRLPIDRVFTMKGFGTVVTGTLISGTVHKEQEVEVHPTGKRLRVRGVQVHGHPAEEAIAGQRTALNLAGVETNEMARGMMLTPPEMFHPVVRLGVQLDLLPSARPLRQFARVHLHAFAAETIARVTLLGTKQLLPGESGFARLKLFCAEQ